jgi:hypothetical protein
LFNPFPNGANCFSIYFPNFNIYFEFFFFCQCSHKLINGQPFCFKFVLLLMSSIILGVQVYWSTVE